MNILVVTQTSTQKGTGGHLHSTFHITDELANDNTVKLIALGACENEFISSSKYYLGFATTKTAQVLGLKRRVYSLVGDFKPDVVLLFIPELVLYFRFFRIFPKAKLVMVKCGGFNPHRSKWIKTENMVMFSRENYEWCKNNPYYDGVNVSLIPNRVKQVNVLDENKRDIEKKDGIFNFLRIARFSDTYISSCLRLIDLVAKLKDDGYNTHLYLMGTINSKKRYEEVVAKVKSSGVECTIITEAETVKEASRYLYLGDCILGTGRSAQEAMSLGVATMVPAANSPYPILLNKNNFENYLDINFSERSVATEDELALNYGNLIRVITDEEYRNEIGKQMQDIFENELSTSQIPKKYGEAFRNAKIKRDYNFTNLLYLVQILIKWR